MTEGEAIRRLLDGIQADAVGLLEIHSQAVAEGWDSHKIMDAMRRHADAVEAAWRQEFQGGGK